ncbi:MAG: hypothetical protein ACRELC_08890 [Gemmatimonadota bacterium]
MNGPPEGGEASRKGISDAPATGERAETRARRGPLIEWLMERDLLRGPFLFLDYWASVLGLEGGVPGSHVRDGLVDPAFYRIGLDRPDLEVPRLRSYVALFLVGPLLLPFRSFRRLGRYRIRFRSAVAERILARLALLRLELRPQGRGRVRVEKEGRVLADDVLDPRLIAGFCSLFYAAYKLPIATFTAVLAMAVLAPILLTAGWLDGALRLWLPVVLPATILLLFAVYRDWPTALLGAVPVLAGRYLVTAFGPVEAVGWGPFLASLAGLLVLALIADWLLIPRPVPPVLMLYARDGPGRAYERSEDAPYWLEGDVYWVWRYLLLVPAELNKFWERDWERVEIWIRADGPTAGRLEWVVLDAHYRELWIPYDGLGAAGRLARHREAAEERAAAAEPGLWLVEVDANLVFHTPFIRTVSFLPEGEAVPARSVRHLLSGLLARGRRDDPDDYLPALDALRIARGVEILDDIPEAIVPFTARHLLRIPWRYWRYPLGAHRRRDRRLYEEWRPEAAPPAADPELQIKEHAS